MIEINLLPKEFRPREKTNVPLILTVACGMLLVGVFILWGISLNRQLGQKKAEYDDLAKKKQGLDDEVKKVKDLQSQIARQKARQDTIIEISQSKVMWSLKLQQLAEILAGFPGFWVENMALSKARSGQALKLSVSATGNDLRKVARFRDALKVDPNFAYHFEDLESYEVKITPVQGYTVQEVMELSLVLPLKQDGGKKKRR